MGFPNFMSAWRSAKGIDQIPRRISTGYSSIRDGNVSIDPSIRNLQQESYGRLGEGVTRYLGDVDTLRGRFSANEGAYTQARVNPILEGRERRRGEITRGLGARGLGGSTFQDQAVTSSDLDYNRAESDARAMAERESVDALSGLDQNRLGAVGMYSEAGMNLAKDRLYQELAALGLGGQQIDQILRSKIAQNQAYNQTLGTVHKLVTDWGDFSKIGGGGGAKV